VVFLAVLALNRTLVLTSPLGWRADLDTQFGESGQGAAQTLAITTSVAATRVEQALGVGLVNFGEVDLGDTGREWIVAAWRVDERALLGGPVLAVLVVFAWVGLVDYR
jgi:hypothetical protein